MIQFTMAFVAGVLLLQNQSDLFHPALGVLLVPAFWVLLRYRHTAWLMLPLGFLCGFVWANLMAHQALNPGLAVELEGQELTVIGYIDSIPEVTSRRSRFRFRVESMQSEDGIVPSPGAVLLSWYQGAPPLVAGDRWQLRVKLKRPHGMLNPGGFDYEQVLFSRGIRATGYIRYSELNRREGRASGFVLLDRLRQVIGERLVAHTGDGSAGAVVRALVIGDRSGIETEQWAVFRQTGTNHLVAISGLHVGMVSGLMLLLGGRLWRCSARLCLVLPAQQAGALAAIFGAFGYAALAGFAIPCVRALVMLCVVLGGLLLRRPVDPFRSLSIALLLVVAGDPLSVIMPGFWLSFGAVAVIILSVNGRFTGRRTLFRSLLRIQWVVALGLAPVLLLLGFGVSPVSPLVNMLAVPLFSLLLVPLCLAGTLLLFLAPVAGGGILVLVTWMMSLFLDLLGAVAEWIGPAVSLGGDPPVLLILGAMAGVLLLLFPAGAPGRWSGVILLLPLLLFRPDRPAQGEVWVTMLDVGQGLAVVIQTSGSLLLYDSGPRFPSGLDTGQAVVLPYLHSLAVERVDRIVLSNGDMDHRGGLASLLEAYPEAPMMSGEPDRIAAGEAAPCSTGESWEWDGVHFEVLHPGRQADWHGNNASCVLSVRSAGGGHLLLTGDIERAAEEALLRQGADRLRANVVTVPHHGSATSSGERFVSAVGAEYALVSAGYRNRYGFPRPEVMARWQSAGTRLVNTARAGAIHLRLMADGSVRGPFLQRQVNARYWRMGHESQ